jgi:hypothetical protein
VNIFALDNLRASSMISNLNSCYSFFRSTDYLRSGPFFKDKDLKEIIGTTQMLILRKVATALHTTITSGHTNPYPNQSFPHSWIRLG